MEIIQKVTNDASNIDEATKKENRVYDIDLGIKCLNNFIKRTISYRKNYKKLTKKMDGKNPAQQKKDNFKFARKYLLKDFKSSVVDVFFTNDEMSYLSEEDVFTYILGVFIAGNSQEPNIKNNINKIYAKVLQELCERSLKNRMRLET